jgi:hypothetical protein
MSQNIMIALILRFSSLGLPADAIKECVEMVLVGKRVIVVDTTSGFKIYTNEEDK